MKRSHARDRDAVHPGADEDVRVGQSSHGRRNAEKGMGAQGAMKAPQVMGLVLEVELVAYPLPRLADQRPDRQLRPAHEPEDHPRHL